MEKKIPLVKSGETAVSRGQYTPTLVVLAVDG